MAPQKTNYEAMKLLSELLIVLGHAKSKAEAKRLIMQRAANINIGDESVWPTALPTEYKCSNCGSKNVEICLPAWFTPDVKQLRSIDWEADGHWFCNDCQNHDTVVNERGEACH